MDGGILAFDFLGPINQELRINLSDFNPWISFKSKIVLSNISEGYPAFKTTTDNLYPDDLKPALVVPYRALFVPEILPVL